MAVTYRVLRLISIVVVAGIVLYGLGSLGRSLVKQPREALTDGQNGSWWFPRGGPYILGFDSPEPATLAIDGDVVLTGRGRVSKRLVYEAGVHSVAFSAPPEARLLWHPPGRRGALEYVSASSLSKLPAERAQFTAPGTDPELAAVAAAMLGVLVLAALRLIRPFADGRSGVPGVTLFLIAIAARVWGIGSAGQTWDEDEYWSSGRNYIENIFAGDFSDAAWSWNLEHPPITKYLAGIGALADDGFTAARLIFVGLGALTCVLVFAIGRRLFGARAGFFAGMACALMPHLVAHSRVVGHETPSVFFWAFAIWLALRSAEDQERPVWQSLRLATVGLAFGLAIATRFTNLLLGPVVFVAALLPAKRAFAWRTMVLAGLIVPLVGAATTVAVWPRLWHDALPHLQSAWNVLRVQHLPENYLGAQIQTPPWHYFPVYFVATTPVLVLVLALIPGAVRAALWRERSFLLVALWLLAPFGVAFSPVRQDGVRYILPAFAALALAAGAGLDLVMERAQRAVFVLGVAFVGYLGYANYRIAPYPLDYFGEHVGGPAKVAARKWFEVGWWGEGIAAAVDYINKNARANARVARLVLPTHVTWLREDLWAGISDSVRADTEWLLVNDLWIDSQNRGFTPPADARLVYESIADGASLVRVYHREKATP